LINLPPKRHNSLLSFAGVGIISTLLTLGVIFALKALTNLADVPINLAGYLVGLCFNFSMNRRFTFRHRDSALPAAFRFLLVFGVAYLVNIGIVLVLLHLDMQAYLAHVGGMPFYTLVSYGGSRWFAFRPSKPTSRVTTNR
jgi:putative flippase GtrA